MTQEALKRSIVALVQARYAAIMPKKPSTVDVTTDSEGNQILSYGPLVAASIDANMLDAIAEGVADAILLAVNEPH